MEENLFFGLSLFIGFDCCKEEQAVQKLLLLLAEKQELWHAKIRACKCIEIGKILLSRSEEAFDCI